MPRCHEEAACLPFVVQAEAATAKREFGNLLEWWKNHQATFPRLDKLAKACLALQATSAPSERVFSQAALVATAKRNRLGSEIAGKLLFLKANWDAEENAGWDVLSCVKAAEEDPGTEMSISMR